MIKKSIYQEGKTIITMQHLTELECICFLKMEIYRLVNKLTNIVDFNITLSD